MVDLSFAALKSVHFVPFFLKLAIFSSNSQLIVIFGIRASKYSTAVESKEIWKPKGQDLMKVMKQVE